MPLRQEAKLSAKQAKERAWKAFMEDVRKDQRIVTGILERALSQAARGPAIALIKEDLVKAINPTRLETMRAAKQAAQVACR